MNDSDIDEELRQLARRKAKLRLLAELRREVEALEKEQLIASQSNVTMSIISDEVGVAFKLSPGFVRSRNRQEEYFLPRQVFFYLCRKLTEAPFKSIGRFANKDHTTVMHGCRCVLDRIDTNADFADSIAELCAACRLKLEEPKAA